MDEKRKGEIALAYMKMFTRMETSLRDIANAKRSIGNRVKKPEMVAIKAKPEELLELSRLILKEVFDEQMKAIS